MSSDTCNIRELIEDVINKNAHDAQLDADRKVYEFKYDVLTALGIIKNQSNES